jgi:hypothetical protein
VVGIAGRVVRRARELVPEALGDENGVGYPRDGLSAEVGANGGRSAVRFQSVDATRVVAVDVGSKRRTAGRLIVFALLSRSVDTKIPLAGSALTRVTPSASGSPVPSG